MLPGEVCETLLDHQEDIVTGSHPSLREAGWLLLRNLLHRYEHVFPAPDEPITGHTTSVQHEILIFCINIIPKKLCTINKEKLSNRFFEKIGKK